MGGLKPPVLTDHGIQFSGFQFALSTQDFGFVLNVWSETEPRPATLDMTSGRSCSGLFIIVMPDE